MLALLTKPWWWYVLATKVVTCEYEDLCWVLCTVSVMEVPVFIMEQCEWLDEPAGLGLIRKLWVIILSKSFISLLYYSVVSRSDPNY